MDRLFLYELEGEMPRLNPRYAFPLLLSTGRPAQILPLDSCMFALETNSGDEKKFIASSEADALYWMEAMREAQSTVVVCCWLFDISGWIQFFIPSHVIHLGVS